MKRSMVTTVLACGISLCCGLAPVNAKTREVPKALFDQILGTRAPGLKSILEAVPDSKISRYTKGPVRVRIRVWAVYSGDGTLPNASPTTNKPIVKPGEIYSIWYYTGEKDLAEVKRTEKLKYIPKFEGGEAPPIFEDDFIIYPAEKSLKVWIKVYDQDRIGDQKAGEIKSFLEEVGAQGQNLYPKSTTVIPALQDLARLLFVSLPNLFLSNDNLGQLEFELHRSRKEGVWIGKMKKHVGYVVGVLTSEPM